MEILLIGFVVPVGASVYFFYQGGVERLWERVLSSYHGLGVLIAFGYADLVSVITSKSHQTFWLAGFLVLLVLSGVSIGYSIYRARVPWYVHLLHLWTLTTGIMLFYLAPMAIQHSTM